MRTETSNEISASELQELVLLLLHHAKSPLVAVSGFIDMAKSEPADRSTAHPAINQKLLRYARLSAERALTLIDTISTITSLSINGNSAVIMPTRLDLALKNSLLNYQASQDQKQLICSIRRSYKLPMVLANQPKLEESLRLLAHIFLSAGPSKQEKLNIGFRTRGDYLVMRLSSAALASALADVRKVFYKKIQLTRLATEHNCEAVVQAYIIRRNIELAGGFVKVEAKRGALTSMYIHLPLSRQLQLEGCLERQE